MKKQTITAAATYLFGGTFFLALLFLLSPATHHALGQAKNAKVQQSSQASATSARGVSGPSTVVPVASSAQVAGAPIAHRGSPFPAPDITQTILYDQTDNPAANSTVSQNFEAANDAFDNQLADDFVVPAGGWTVGQVNVLGVYFNGSGPARDVNVFFYVDAGGLPGAPVPGGTYMNAAITSGAATGAFNICLPTTLALAPGHYWVSVQANMDFPVGGEWGWTDRVVTSNSPAAWQNPGGGFATACTTWGQRGPTCLIDNGNNDQLFQLLTQPAGGCPISIVCPPCGNYTTATSAGAIVPGTADIGNHCDDCATPIALPFPVTVYGQVFNNANVSSNGSLDLVGTQSPFTSGCQVLPSTLWTMAILPYQDDLHTGANPGCAGFPGGQCGVFTSVTGTAPNRQFHIEWRTSYFGNTSGAANFEVRLYENNASFFDVVYGATADSGSGETSGVQDQPTGRATTFSCAAATLTPGLQVRYTASACPPPPVPTSAVSRKVHGGAGTFDINLPLVPISGAVGIEDRLQGGTTGGNILWYNGDFNGVNGLANEVDPTVTTGASVYDNFVVTNPAGWDITAVFSDNLENMSSVTSASWEIRTGVSVGNGGTLVASGSGTPTVTATGRSGFGFTEYQIQVAISPALHLPQLPAGQFYWLNVTPTGPDGRSFDSTTSGANAVGQPPGNDLNAFFNSVFFSANFQDTASQGQPSDFSMGVIGNGAVTTYPEQIVVTFANPVTVSSVSVTNGTGSVASFAVAGNVVTVNLTGVTDVQRLGVTLRGVCDGTNQGDVLIPMGVLGGDTNASTTVTAADVGQTKAQSGNTANAGNFRTDVNGSGSISAADVGLVKSKSGTQLPPQ